MKAIPFDIPSNWTWTTMGEIADVVGGGTPRTNDPENYEGGTIPWITPADLSGYTAKNISHGERFITTKGLAGSSAKMMPSGTVLFSSRAPVGYVAIAANPVCTNQGFKSFVLKTKEILPDYIYWWLKGSKDLAESLASGTTFLELSGAKAKQLPVPLAPPGQQQSIVAEIEKQFSRLDEAVASLKRTKANLKRYKASVLKAAVEGKLTDDWRRQHPDVEPASKLLERILGQRRAQWKGSGKYKEPIPPDTGNLPLLPENWTWASVGQVAEVSLGKMLDKQKHRTGRQLPYLRNINVRWGRVDTNDLLEMFFKDDELKRYGLLPGDVLVCEGGEPGRAAVWDGRIPELKYQKALHRVRFYGRTEPRYLVFLLEFLANTGRLERWFTGSTIRHFTRESFISMPISLPPLNEQREIIAEGERRLSVIDELEATVEANLARADSLRQSILKRAFEGKLVPQILTDEPASVLLERLKTRKVKTNEMLSVGLMEVGMVKRKIVARDKQPIVHVLKEANRWLSTTELLAKAGYSKDAAPEEMEAFYLELKKELQAEPRRIEVERRHEFDHFRAI